MRIDGLGRAIGGASTARPGGVRGGFQLLETSDAPASRRATPLRAAPSLDALIALQAVVEETPRERRRRALARGRGMLNALDGMKLALIDGRDDPAALTSLAARIGETRGLTDEPGLDEALSAIELRAKVELAKRGL